MIFSRISDGAFYFINVMSLMDRSVFLTLVIATIAVAMIASAIVPSNVFASSDKLRWNQCNGHHF
jgi:hypothetical protein